MFFLLVVEKFFYWLMFCKDVLVVFSDMSIVIFLSSGKDEEFEKKDEMDDDIMFIMLGEEDKLKFFVVFCWVI